MVGKRGRPLDPRMPADTRPSTQKISLVYGRKVDTYPSPLTRTYSVGGRKVDTYQKISSLCTSFTFFGGAISIMAQILSRLASIPL